MKLGEYVFHITAIKNLESLIHSGYIYSQDSCGGHEVVPERIGYASLKDRRSRTPVPCFEGTFLSQFVPFYFAPRSPMLYAIHQNQVEDCSYGQEDVIHLVFKLDAINKANLDFAFTDGHAVMEISKFYKDLEDLSQIDWSLMRSKYWNDTEDDGDRKRRRQAEFLILDKVPIGLLAGIAVIGSDQQVLVKGILAKYGVSKSVKVLKNWYY